MLCQEGIMMETFNGVMVALTGGLLMFAAAVVSMVVKEAGRKA
jgi:hypothetical protein